MGEGNSDPQPHQVLPRYQCFTHNAFYKMNKTTTEGTPMTCVPGPEENGNGRLRLESFV